ncbi:MAG: histidine--tRNA ligase [Candidatus Sulfotelmatobacter sp.]
MIKAVRGTRDLLPPDTALWNFVESEVREVFRAYNFHEIRTPIFESTELFARGVGEETDVVSKEMFTWSDGERFDEEALATEWIARGLGEKRFFVESATQLNSYLSPLRIRFINHIPDRPEFVCFRPKATLEAVELMLKTRDEIKSPELLRRYSQDAEYLRRFEIGLRIVVPSGTAESATWIDTHGVEVEQFQNRTPVFKSSQSLTLRPENTAGVVRAYIEHDLEKHGLNKLYYIGPQFRRERPQKGRYRQFYQIGAEVIGPPSSGSQRPLRDAELIEMLASLLDRLGISGYTLELNSVGSSESRGVFNEALRKALQPVVGQMCSDCRRRAVTNPLRVFDCKVPADQPIIEKLPQISGFLDDESRQHFEHVKALLRSAHIDFQLNPRLVRGLDYYTRTAFEFTHGALGAQNAILGGGRYDGLSEALGGPSAPGIGFAIGEDRLILTLQALRAAPSAILDVYIVPVGAGMNRKALGLAKELRRQGLVVELGDRSYKLGKLLERASKAGARLALIVRESEANIVEYLLKDLGTSEQTSVPRAELAQRIRE